MQAIVEAAPQLIDFLGAASLAHFDGRARRARRRGLAYRINPRLVRGLDYYNLTVFEWVTDQLGAQGTVCGGGRYDGLFEQLGGKPTPAVGFGMGIERLLLLLEAVGVRCRRRRADAYAVVPGAERAADGDADAARRCAPPASSVLMHARREAGSMKAQFKKADASGARYALIFGADELARGEVALKSLRDAGAPQRTLPLGRRRAAWAAELRTA